MAYVDDQNLDSQGQQQAAPSQGGAPTLPGSSGGAAVGASKDQPTTSGQFVNLQGYLNANAGQNFGSQIAGRIQGDVDQANNTQAQTGQQFQSRVDQNAVQADPNLVNSTLSNPQAAASNPNQAAAFQKQLNAEYAGPTAFAGSGDLYNQAYGQTQQAQQEAQASQSEGGRFALLNRYFGNPNYNQGERTLDNLLVQNDQTAAPAFQKAQAGAQQASNNFQDLQSRLNNYANNAQAQTQAAREQSRAALGVDGSGNLLQQNGQYQGAFGNLQNPVLQRVQDANSNAQPEYNKVAAALGAHDATGLSAQELSSLGLNNFSGALYGANPNGFLTQNPVDATTNTAITSPEQAQLAALYQLAGVQNTFAPDASKAGTNLSPYSFDSKGFQSAVTAGQQKFNKDLSSAKGDVSDGSGIPPFSGMSLTDAMTGVQKALSHPENYGPLGKQELEHYQQELQAKLDALKTSDGANTVWNGQSFKKL